MYSAPGRGSAITAGRAISIARRRLLAAISAECLSARRRGIARAARHRRLYGGRHRCDCLRRAGGGDGCQRRTRDRAAFCGGRTHGPCQSAIGRTGSATGAQRPARRFRAKPDGFGLGGLPSKNPLCGDCPLRSRCRAYRLGLTEIIPRRAAKRARPVKRGAAFVAFDKSGAVYLERRPERGLARRDAATAVKSVGHIVSRDRDGIGGCTLRRALGEKARFHTPCFHPFRIGNGSLCGAVRTPA